jgi:hypothetical protein
LSKPAVQISQFALQVCHTVFEIGIFFSEGFGNFQIIAAVPAHGGIIVDILGAKRATHDNEPRYAC